MLASSPIIVGDLGLEFMKIGYCGDESPSVFSPSGGALADPALFVQSLGLLREEGPLHLIVTENNIERGEFLEVLFEQCVAESLFFVDSDVLDLFSYNRTSGVIVNYGGKTTVTSVLDGNVERKVKREGGLALNAFISETLGLQSTESVHLFKEQHLEVGGGGSVEFSGRLYDTKAVNTKAGELLVVDGIVRDLVDTSNSKGLLSANIYMAGGGSKTAGLEHRMREGLKGFRNRIACEIKFHTFFGASVLGSITQARPLFICSRDYEEYGQGILDRKCLYSPNNT